MQIQLGQYSVSFIRQGFMEMAPVPLSPHAEVRQQQRGIHREVYAVIDSDGYVVTTGHRYRRILRDKSQSNFRASRRRTLKQHH